MWMRIGFEDCSTTPEAETRAYLESIGADDITCERSVNGYPEYECEMYCDCPEDILNITRLMLWYNNSPEPKRKEKAHV